MNLNSNHYKYTHWLRLDSVDELEKWQNLKKYKDKYDCYMTVFYYDYNTLTDKVIKLDCNQSYQELDLDLNSLSKGSLKRVKAKPTNVTAYNKGINHFFKIKLGINMEDQIDKNSNSNGINEKDLIPVDVLSEFKHLENIDLFAKILEKEQWQVVKIKSDRSYHYQLYFGKDKQFKNRFEYAFSKFMYKSIMEDRLQRFINNCVKSYEVNLNNFIGHKINSFQSKYELVTGERVGMDLECIGLVLGIDDNKVDVFDFKRPLKEQLYSIDIDLFKKNFENGFYKVNYNLLSNLEKMEFRKYTNHKLEKFAELCGDWDFRKIDMTDSHLSSIGIKDNTISISCEKYSTKIDEYVSCSAGEVKDRNLVREFRLLDLTNYEKVLAFISEINHYIDYDKVDNDLDIEEQKFIEKQQKDNPEETLDEMEMDF